jgi:hypothetical protein
MIMDPVLSICFVGAIISCLKYSGGQATEGQGGYYGSGGARVGADTSPGTEDRRAVLAMASDVQKITAVMDELDKLESLLRREEEKQKASSPPDKTVLQLKASIKKLMTAPDTVEALNRLEIQGEPVWGLSTDEREMIVLAREKVNEC